MSTLPQKCSLDKTAPVAVIPVFTFVWLTIERPSRMFPPNPAPHQVRVITLNDDEALIVYAKPIVNDLRTNMVRAWKPKTEIVFAIKRVGALPFCGKRNRLSLWNLISKGNMRGALIRCSFHWSHRGPLPG
jgi:hypothetical protein